MEYSILIDYDNLTIFQKRKGLLYNVEIILSHLKASEVNSKNIKFRLYGGWWENSNLTKLAQSLNAEISSVFPAVVELGDQSKVIVALELANSLIISPSKLLYHTYRKRGSPAGLGCDHPVNTGCFQAICPVKTVHEFFEEGKCSTCKHVTPEKVLFRKEQKLIDSMITSDMIYLSQNSVNMGLVSSDDDFWPAILTAVTLGSNITQFQTGGKVANSLYSSTVPVNYAQIIL